MNKLSKMMDKLVVIAQILAITLLTGCTPNTLSIPSTICHATGDAANPYEEITFNSNDIIPAPVGGCPTSPVVINNGKITICHATSSKTNPYNEITASVNGLDGHGLHEGDIIPAPEGGCPTSLVAINNDDGKITVCHATGDAANPYEEIAVSSAELNDHVGHPNDIIQAPVSGCPTSLVVITDSKITVCHATSSETNPYNEITVSVNGLNGHDKHEGDIIPAPEGGCPTSPVVINNDGGKITICHATSSKKNPYNEITVSVNGLNGHGKHEGDIIPAPEGGCPTTK
jgi:hypothetical protein